MPAAKIFSRISSGRPGISPDSARSGLGRNPDSQGLDGSFAKSIVRTLSIPSGMAATDRGRGPPGAGRPAGAGGTFPRMPPLEYGEEMPL